MTRELRKGREPLDVVNQYGKGKLKLVFDKIRLLFRLCYKVILKIMETLSLKKLLPFLFLVTEITSNLGMNRFFK